MIKVRTSVAAVILMVVSPDFSIAQVLPDVQQTQMPSSASSQLLPPVNYGAGADRTIGMRAAVPISQTPGSRMFFEQGAPAEFPSQPEGGLKVMPASPKAGDVASRQNLGNADNYLETLTKSASERLAGLVGDETLSATGNIQVSQATVNGRQSGQDTAPVSSPNEVDQLTRLKMSTEILKRKVDLAEQAVKLWHVLYNNEDAKAWRDEEKKIKNSDAAKAAQASASASLSTPMLGSSGPSVPHQPIVAKPVVVEVVGSKATLLVPGFGEMKVTVGKKLPDGSVVSYIGSNGVVVSEGGKKTNLMFGSAVSNSGAAYLTKK